MRYAPRMRTRSFAVVLAAAALSFATPAGAGPGDPPNLDFESGLTGWTKTGTAFDFQPTAGNAATSDTSNVVPLGGDYWKGVPYPVGQHGDFWLSTAWKRPTATAPAGVSLGDGPTGTLISSEFVMQPAMEFLSVLVGGTNDVANERFELQAFAANAAEAQALEAIAVKLGTPPRRGAPLAGWYTMVQATGANKEALTRHVFPLGTALAGKKARFQIVDSAATGHINVDDIRLTRAADPITPNGDVWGIADLHTHPMAHMGFGGLRGNRTVWGTPGGAYGSYVNDPALIRRDIPECDDHHLAGRLAPWMINAFELHLPKGLFSMVGSPGREHGHAGGTGGAKDFTDYPGFMSGAHEQYHITQIRRAYEGGLRLMSALAVNNALLEFMMTRPHDGPGGVPHIATTSDFDVIKAHVCGMQQLVRLNGDWMAIATSPAHARQIIQSNRLAIILGVEIDRLGSLGLGSQNEIQALYDLGIRQITPIHATDNALGGAALFTDGYNTVNDWQNRPDWTKNFSYEASSSAEKNAYLTNPAFFSLDKTMGCKAGSTRGECVLFRFNEEQTRAIIGNSAAVTLADTHAQPHAWRDLLSPPAYKKDPAVTGHRNTRGLTPIGMRFMTEMMHHGMLIDVAHMSDVAVGQAITEAKNAGYPLMVSHVGFRQQMFMHDYSDMAEDLVKLCSTPVQVSRDICAKRVLDAFKANGLANGNQIPGGTTSRGFLPKEFDLSTAQADLIAGMGGVIAPFLAQDPIDPSQQTLPFADDCAMSSKGYGASMIFGQKHFRSGNSIGVASDFGLHATVAPRFGKNACSSYYKVAAPDAPVDRMVETLVNSGQFQFAAQNAAVRYAGQAAVPGVVYGNNPPLTPYKMGNRTYDFNVDGLANYGLLPDMLQDLKNLGMDVAPLFASAEGYLKMWEKAWAAGKCTDATCGALPKASDCTQSCGSLCAESWNAGAPLHKLAMTQDKCQPQKPLRILSGGQVVGSDLLTDEMHYSLIYTRTPNVRWSCGGVDEVTRCPAGTNFVKVLRSVQDAIHVDCLTSQVAPLPQLPPPTPAVTLGQVVGKCGRQRVSFVGGLLESGPDQLTNTTEHQVGTVKQPRIYWSCSDAGAWDEENNDCPAGTNTVRVHRAGTRDVVIDCLKR